ncbi:MAG: hypothetical protein AAF468_03355 [Pseudomonadota bacterium]
MFRTVLLALGSFLLIVGLTVPHQAHARKNPMSSGTAKLLK